MEADQLEPLRVLIVEDELLIAMELERLVREAGHEPVGAAADAGQALRLARDARPELALVDLNLRDGRTGPEIVRALARDLGVAGLFVTASRGSVPADFAGALGVLGKPLDEGRLAPALRWAAARLRGGDAVPPPEGLELAPPAR
jgi:two-component system, response regulator PdtaR